MGENICKWSNYQRINLQNVQLMQFNNNKKFNQQMGRRSK